MGTCYFSHDDKHKTHIYDDRPPSHLFPSSWSIIFNPTNAHFACKPQFLLHIVVEMVETVDSATQTHDLSEFGSEASNSCEKTANPKAEIDTSPPFGSVEEAVIRFGGRGYWIPRPLLGVAAAHHEAEDFDVGKLEEQAVETLKHLTLKEQEALEILTELEVTKRLVEELTLNMQKEASECLQSHQTFKNGGKCHVVKDPANSISVNHQLRMLESSDLFSLPSCRLMTMELKQAKLNLYRNTCDLAAIRASIVSLNQKLQKEKSSLDRVRARQTINMTKETAAASQRLNEAGATVQVANDSSGISKDLRELNYEAEQFMKTAEAARAEVSKAMLDIERTKAGLKLIEMKWVAAKKLEEAAKASEAVAVAEIKALSSSDSSSEAFHNKTGRISLSFQEYSSLVEKARRAENLFGRLNFDRVLQNAFTRLEDTTEKKIRKMALGEVLGRSEVLNRRKVANEEAVGSFGSGLGQNKIANHLPDPMTSVPFQQRRDSGLLNVKELDFMTDECRPPWRPTTSIGDFLNRKPVLQQGDSYVERENESLVVESQRMSLNQMLRKHRQETSPIRRRKENTEKFLPKRKSLGFVHIPLPLSKQSKNKVQALNLW
ncbi:hypothetical protein Dimus_033462 [Dionaea muscipula]